jgi:hypothetical protein
VKKAKAGH